jgi:hypothetical protein
LWKLGRPHGGLARATMKELMTPPAIPRHSRTHRVGDAARAAPADGYQSMRKR